MGARRPECPSCPDTPSAGVLNRHSREGGNPCGVNRTRTPAAAPRLALPRSPPYSFASANEAPGGSRDHGGDSAIPCFSPAHDARRADRRTRRLARRRDARARRLDARAEHFGGRRDRGRGRRRRCRRPADCRNRAGGLPSPGARSGARRHPRGAAARARLRADPGAADRALLRAPPRDRVLGDRYPVRAGGDAERHGPPARPRHRPRPHP